MPAQAPATPSRLAGVLVACWWLEGLCSVEFCWGPDSSSNSFTRHNNVHTQTTPTHNTMRTFPQLGAFMEKQLTMRGGQTPVQRYWKLLLDKVGVGCTHRVRVGCACVMWFALVCRRHSALH